MSKLQPLLDSCAVGISAICAVHCLALPVLLLVFPLLGSSLITDELFHVLVLWVILPTSALAVLLGRARHPDRTVLLWVVSGMVILVIGALWAHDHAEAWVDRTFALIGGLILALGHIRNYHLCRHRN